MEKKIIKVLRKYRRFLVTMHAHPDPDAMGAALAMALYLKSLGKDVRLVNEDACPSFLAFMPKSGFCKKFNAKEKFVPEVAVILDCGDLDRIGKVRGMIAERARIVNIDHHVTNTFFGHDNLVLTQYSSTCEILFQLLKKAGCRLTKDMAILLYLGILTDTGSFGFDCTGPHTHRVIAELLEFDFSVSDLYRKVYETMPRGDLRPFLEAVGRIELCLHDRVACLTMTKKDTGKFSGEFDFRDKVFTFLRSVNGLEVIVIVTEGDNGRTRINLRSRDAFDVALLAEKFGGGGHRKASGCFIDGTVDAAKKKILAVIRKGL